MKKIALILAMTMSAGMFAGCGQTAKEVADDGKIHITVSDFPTNANPTAQELQQSDFDRFMEANPDVAVEGDQYAYSVDTFLPLVNSGKIPTLYKTWFTEIDKIVDSGYAADITAAATKYGYDEMFEDNIADLMKKDGKIYGIPNSVYTMGLDVNRKLFEEAGLLDENGVPIVPQTWDELVKTAVTIKQKTGKAGFAIPTTQNYGGWNFMNIAWSYGGNFMEVRDGKPYAIFNNEGVIKAFELIYDMKWKYNVLPENTFLSAVNVQELFGTYNSAMNIASSPAGALTATYKMSKDDIAHFASPAGPAGRYALLGGEVWFIKPDATEEEIDACLRYLKFKGIDNVVTESAEKSMREKLADNVENGYPVISKGMGYPMYKLDGERQKQINKIYADYQNVNPDLYNAVTDDMIIRAEEPYKAQELYKTIDGILQEILVNKNADIPALVAQAEKDFQHNHFDNYEIK